jgi:hypothetical protein
MWGGGAGRGRKEKKFKDEDLGTYCFLKQTHFSFLNFYNS